MYHRQVWVQGFREAMCWVIMCRPDRSEHYIHEILKPQLHQPPAAQLRQCPGLDAGTPLAPSYTRQSRIHTLKSHVHCNYNYYAK